MEGRSYDRAGAPLGAASATDGEEPIWVLKPNAAAALVEAAADPAADVRVEDVTIDRSNASVRACVGVECVTLALSHPDRVCGGEIHGPWCVSGPRMHEPIAEPLLGRLAAISDEIWTRRPAAVKSIGHGKTAERIHYGEAEHWDPGAIESDSNLPAYALALGLPVGAGLLGLVCGKVLGRRRRFESGTSLAVLLLGLPILCLILPFWWLPLGYADRLLLSIGSSLGLAWGAHARGAGVTLGHVGLALASLLFVLGLAEVVSRTALPEPPEFPPPHSAQLLFRPVGVVDAELWMLAPRQNPDAARQLEQRRIGRTFLHVGDSMLRFAPRTRTSFVEHLDALDRSTSHVNVGVPGSATDFHLLQLEQLLPWLEPDGVVLYVFGNDFSELDQRSGACGCQSLLRPGTPIRARCAEPERSGCGVALTAPYAVRVATGFSFLARHVTRGFWSIGALRPERTIAEEATRFREVMRAVLVLCREAGVTTHLVRLPRRSAIEGDALMRERDQSQALVVRELARDFAVPLSDAWDFVSAQVAREGADVIFSDSVHFGRRGHELMAEWLYAQLAREE